MKNNLFFTFFLLGASVAVAQEKPQGLALMSKAPDFNAKDQNGKNITLKALRRNGPVVILFYRGNWCPYCNKQLNELQDSLQYITAKDAQVVAITPEASDGINKTIEKTGAAFSVLNDKDVVISKAYNVSYEVDTATMNMYKKNWDVDFRQINQQKDKAYLPVPAVYIVNSKGIITYRFFETDVTKRPSVKELLENLNP
jgi:peroxiredoxin